MCCIIHVTTDHDPPFQNLCIFTAAGVKYICGGPKSIPVLHHSAIIFSDPLGSMSSSWVVSNGYTVLLKDMLEGVSSVVFELRHKKTCLCHMRTTKAQNSLRIRAV